MLNPDPQVYPNTSTNRDICRDYEEPCEADMDLVDLVEAVEQKGFILG